MRACVSPDDNISVSWRIFKISKLKWISAIREWSFCYSQRCPMLLVVWVVEKWPFGLIFFDRHSSSTAADIVSSKQHWDLFYTSFESWEQGEQLLCTSNSSQWGWPVENNFWTSDYRVQNRLCNSSSGDALTNRSRVRSPAAHRNFFVFFFFFLPKDGKCLIRCLMKNVCPFNYNVCRTCSRSCIFRLCRFTCFFLYCNFWSA